MTRLMVDSNVFDELAFDEDLTIKCVAATINGSLELVVTHIQADELAAISDQFPDFRAFVIDHLEHLATTVVTAGNVVGISRWGLSSLPSESALARHKAFVGNSPRRAKDAPHPGDR